MHTYSLLCNTYRPSQASTTPPNLTSNFFIQSAQTQAKCRSWVLLHQRQHRKSDSQPTADGSERIVAPATLKSPPPCTTHIQRWMQHHISNVKITKQLKAVTRRNKENNGFICGAATYVDYVKLGTFHHLNVNSQSILEIYQYAKEDR